MNKEQRLTRLIVTSKLALWLVIATMLLLMQPDLSWAHGGEDHGAQKPAQAPILPVGATNIKLVKTSTLEILVKYPTPKFGVETSLRIFITDLKTNAPISAVNATVLINALNQANVSGTSASISPISATPTDKAGIYEAKVSFPDKGIYNITLKLTGANIDAQTMIPGVVVPDITIEETSNTNVKSWQNLPKIYFILPIVFVVTVVLGILLWQRTRQLSKSRQSNSERVA